MNTQQSRPIYLKLLLVALLFQGISGIAGGIGLIGDPSGNTLGIPLAWLSGSPFADYLIPGVTLLVVLGIFPLGVLYGLWTGKRWGWIGSLLIGIALLIWLLVEILIIGYQPQPPLQVIYGIVGFVIVVLTSLPPVRAHYAIS